MYAQCLSCDECRVLVATSQAHATCHALATCHVHGAYSHHLARPRHTHKQPRNRDGQSETQNKHVNSTLILLACQGQAMEAFERRSLAFCKECHLQSTQLSKKKQGDAKRHNQTNAVLVDSSSAGDEPDRGCPQRYYSLVSRTYLNRYRILMGCSQPKSCSSRVILIVNRSSCAEEAAPIDDQNLRCVTRVLEER